MEQTNPQLPVKCPSCESGLKVKTLRCETCETTVSGLYDLPILLQFEQEELNFILSFVKKSGSLKEMSKEMGLSYPSVRNYLNDLIQKINKLEDEYNREKK